MSKSSFCIVDVFAERKYSGNQLAVFRGVKGLSETEMQQIAREMNFSETTFILSDEKHDEGYDVRIFTPQVEVPFAGHPTLGTAHVIQKDIIKRPINEIILNLKIGQISVFFSNINECSDILWMRQPAPVFGATFEADLVSKFLSLDIREIDDRFPIQSVSTGLPTLIVPLKTLKSVKRAHVVNSKYLEFSANIEAKTLLIFCPETYNRQNDLNVRFFAGRYGIPEDPATGSGNGCLAGYLVKHGYYKKENINLKVEQGCELGRHSLVLLKAENNKTSIVVHVGGKVKTVAKGVLV
jgi:trans-2,3-dihydro-3-hydroxyanthranilate isomerase